MMSTDRRKAIRAIAFYLPQYHPIPENDDWWGRGFTEWTNVVKTRPRYRGHEQPHLPADLGFYDLRLPEARIAQAQLANANSISGFCYWHYWFNGRQLLERPFREVLQSGEPDFPFMLAWANENWTRIWDGGSSQILLEQTYSSEDAYRHGVHLAAAFKDPRYIRKDGLPLFLIYRGELPDSRRLLAQLRRGARDGGGGDISIGRIDAGHSARTDLFADGYDLAVEFQPDVQRLGPMTRGLTHRSRHRRGDYVYDYGDLVTSSLDHKATYPRLRCVTPGWDNSPRREQGALMLLNSTPEAYGRWLHRVASEVAGVGRDDIIFVNAWNEWAEGNHLEPDTRWGSAFLQQTKQALQGL